jgi:hypothetical protein
VEECARRITINRERHQLGCVPALVQETGPGCPALLIKTKMLVDDPKGLGLTSLVKSLAETLKEI